MQRVLRGVQCPLLTSVRLRYLVTQVYSDRLDGFLWQIVRQARTEGDRLHALSTDRAENLTRALEHHEAILMAIENGDGDAASARMQEHMAQNQSIFHQIREEDIDCFVEGTVL